MNSLLVENAICFDENFILPKSLCLCVIRYIEDEGMARGSEEMQHMEHGVMITGACAREEWEEGARGEDHQGNQAKKVQTGLSGLKVPVRVLFKSLSPECFVFEIWSPQPPL